MDLEEAKKFLSGATRSELRDHAFGDMEVSWEKDGKCIATGYIGRSMAYVTIGEEDDTTCSFENDDAHSLMSIGILGQVGRNDETGPDDFVEGRIMPGLTLEGVRQELTGE